jgi:hypothetical protein
MTRVTGVRPGPGERDDRHGPRPAGVTPYNMSSETGTTTPRLFLLSPANCGGKRAQLLLGGQGRFPLAQRLAAKETITLGEAFSFLSGLYFRGKLAYARRFARPPAGVLGVQVITTNRGLLPADTPVSADELRAFAAAVIRADDPAFRDPLRRGVAAIEDVASLGAAAPPEIVLLGSVATGKYVDVLLDLVGERLLIPEDFVGRGDMSRGALLLRAARSERELAYAPAATTVRRGKRPRKTDPTHAIDGDRTASLSAIAVEG